MRGARRFDRRASARVGYYKGCYKADYKGLMNMKRKPRQDSPPKYVVLKISFFYIIP